MMKLTTRFISLAALMMLVGVMLMSVMVACGAGSESAAAPAHLAMRDSTDDDNLREELALERGFGFPGSPGSPGAPGPGAMMAAAPVAPAPAATAAPKAAAMMIETAAEKAAEKEISVNPDAFVTLTLLSDEGSQTAEFSEEQAAQTAEFIAEQAAQETEFSKERAAQEAEFSDERAAQVAQNRIIVRTVNLNLEVDDVVDSIEVISQNVQLDGGWVVSTDRSSQHYGYISVRVPAEKLDSALKWMRAVGVDVLSEASTSTDVTDEYYDLRSRVKSMQATEEALIRLLDRAEDVEDALEVQRELAQLQVEIEAHLGRIKLLEETAAFSLVNISLSLAPQEMQVDAGEDRTFSVGEHARFRATFFPQEGIDDFNFTWDFGDGSQVLTGTGSAPRADGGRITATVNHQYISDRDSPYIVEVTMTGRGEAGIVEGSDTFIATVTELPAISVFAGDHKVVEEGEEVDFSGSFTRPEGLTNYQYTWEFSDGTPAVNGVPAEGSTAVETLHVFENHRPQSYTVTLTVSADSEAGKVEGSSSIEVFVQEAKGFVLSGWSAGDNLKGAIRALSGVAQAAGTVAIWAAIFIPVWLIIGAVIFVVVKLRRRLIDNSRRQSASDSDGNESNGATAQTDDAEEQD